MTRGAHLRRAGTPGAEPAALLRTAIRDSPRLMEVLRTARARLHVSWRKVSGAINDTLWNRMTGRPPLHGIRDIDLFYHDADTAWEAEDRLIRAFATACPAAPPVEARNHARVLLWYRRKFGRPCPPPASVEDAIGHFPCIAHMVGVWLEPDDSPDIHAPRGLEGIFAFRPRPNPAMPNRETHKAKAARQSALWPELRVEPWPGTD